MDRTLTQEASEMARCIESAKQGEGNKAVPHFVEISGQPLEELIRILRATARESHRLDYLCTPTGQLLMLKLPFGLTPQQLRNCIDAEMARV